MKLIIDSKDICWLPTSNQVISETVSQNSISSSSSSSSTIVWLISSEKNIIDRIEYIESHCLLTNLVIFANFEIDAKSHIDLPINIVYFNVPTFSIFESDLTTNFTVVNKHITGSRSFVFTMNPRDPHNIDIFKALSDFNCRDICISTKYCPYLSRHEFNDFGIGFTITHFNSYIHLNLNNKPAEFNEQFRSHIAIAKQLNCNNIFYSTGLSCNVMALNASEYGDYMKAHEVFCKTIKLNAQLYPSVQLFVRSSEKGNYLSSCNQLSSIIKKIDEPNVIQIEKRKFCFTNIGENQFIIDYPFTKVFGNTYALHGFLSCLHFFFFHGETD